MTRRRRAPSPGTAAPPTDTLFDGATIDRALFDELTVTGRATANRILDTSVLGNSLASGTVAWPPASSESMNQFRNNYYISQAYTAATQASVSQAYATQEDTTTQASITATDVMRARERLESSMYQMDYVTDASRYLAGTGSTRSVHSLPLLARISAALERLRRQGYTPTTIAVNPHYYVEIERSLRHGSVMTRTPVPVTPRPEAISELATMEVHETDMLYGVRLVQDDYTREFVIAVEM